MHIHPLQLNSVDDNMGSNGLDAASDYHDAWSRRVEEEIPVPIAHTKINTAISNSMR